MQWPTFSTSCSPGHRPAKPHILRSYSVSFKELYVTVNSFPPSENYVNANMPKSTILENLLRNVFFNMLMNSC